MKTFNTSSPPDMFTDVNNGFELRAFFDTNVGHFDLGGFGLGQFGRRRFGRGQKSYTTLV